MRLPRWLTLCGQGTHACACGLCSVALWTLWLVLIVALIVQVVIASVREVAVPGFVLRRIEQRLEDAGIRAQAEDARFDPAGHVLLRDVTVSVGPGTDPSLQAKSVLIQLDLWALAIGDVRLEAVHVSGGRLLVPTLFSPSGQPEPVVDDVDLDLRAAEDDDGWVLHQLTARAGTIRLQAHGELAPPAARTAEPAAKRLARWAAQYPRLSGQIAAQLAHLPPDSELQVSIDLQRDRVLGTLGSPRWQLPAALTRSAEPISAEGLVLRFHAPWQRGAIPAAVRFAVELDRLDGGGRGQAEGLRLTGAARQVDGAWRLRPMQLSAARLATPAGVELRNVLVAARLAEWPQIEARITAQAFDAPWSLEGSGRVDDRSATVAVEATITPALLAWAGARAGRPLAELLRAERPPRVLGQIALGPGGRPHSASAVLETGPVVARQVALDRASGRLTWNPDNLRVDDIVLRAGASEARGSYRMDPATRDFRFLLQGRLEPAAIDGWFRDWWPRFWRRFDFGASLPLADVDVQGRWGDPRRAAVFVAAEDDTTALQGAAFDRIRTRLFVRPGFVDVVEFIGDRGGRTARGTFARTWDPAAPGWRSLSFDVRGDTDLAPAPALFGPIGHAITAPFAFAQPPALHVRGRLERDAEDGPVRSDVRIDGDAAGDWSFHGFPLHDLHFEARLRDDVLLIDYLATGFASGRATGRAELRGLQTERRLAFDLALNDARLGESIRTLETWSAARRGEPPAPESRFQQRIAPGVLDLALSAEGHYDDPYSLRGDGNAVITGAELGEINLLGILSSLLRRTIFNFTTLQLDNARTNFTLDGRTLHFPDLRLSGKRAAIEASGDYRLDTKQLAFHARVLPFDASDGFLSSTVGAVLTPLSHVLEVRLGGRLDEPDWAFLYGPTSLLRAITGEAPAPPPPVRPGEDEPQS